MRALVEEELWPQTKWAGRPTLQAQINFTQGGIILAVRAAHSVADGHGLLMITNVWAAYCRGEDGSLLLGKDSLNRSRLMSGPPATLSEFRAFTELPSKKEAPEHGLARTFFKSWEWVSTRTGASLVSALRIISDVITYRSTPMALRTKNPIEEGTTQTEIFFFLAARLRELKEVITASKKAEKQAESKAWISTHGALVSLLWCCITQTWKDSNYFERDSNLLPLRRLLLQMFLRTTKLISILAFYVNGRRFIKDPPLQSYIGNVVITTGLGGPFTDVGSTLDSAARYAYALRRKTLEFDEDHLMRFVSAFGSVPDVTRLRLDWGPFPESAICVDYYGTDWGSMVGDRPERIRWSRFEVSPFCLIMPKLEAKDGWSEDECGLEVGVHLKSIYMRMLRQDKLFNRFAEWRCS